MSSEEWKTLYAEVQSENAGISITGVAVTYATNEQNQTICKLTFSFVDGKTVEKVLTISDTDTPDPNPTPDPDPKPDPTPPILNLILHRIPHLILNPILIPILHPILILTQHPTDIPTHTTVTLCTANAPKTVAT